MQLRMFVCAAVFTILPAFGQVRFNVPPVSPLSAGFGQVYAAASADFNEDGLPDYAVANGISVEVVLNRGNYSFTAGNIYQQFSGYMMVAGDFNHDGHADLAISNYVQVGILLGNGDGTFSVGTVLNIAEQSRNIAAADLNGDGRPDLVICGALSSGGAFVQTLLGNGDGTFNPLPAQNLVPSAYGFLSLAIADLTGDGKLDAALIAQNGDFSGAVYLARGNGDGTFQAVKLLNATGTTPLAIAAADLKGDGKPDILLDQIASSGASENLTVLVNEGDQNFTPVYIVIGAVPAVLSAGPIVVADFNGDSIPDVFISGAQNTPGASHFFAGDGNGFLARPSIVWTLPAVTAVAADFNADGKLDIGLVGPYSVSVAPGNGDGTFASAVATVGPLSFGVIRAKADFNNDGGDDLLLDARDSSNSGIAVDLALGNGAFQTNPLILNPPTSLSPAAATAADVNGDGKPDVILISGSQQSSTTYVTTYLGNGDGTFGAPMNTATIPVIAADEFGTARLADIDGDGKVDLVLTLNVFNQGVDLVVLKGNGDGTFQNATSLGQFPSANQNPDLAIGDFNGDGVADIAVLVYRQLVVYCGVRNGLPTQTFSATPAKYLAGIVAADFTGDGLDDIAIAASENSGVSHILLFTAKGDGTFQSSGSFPASTSGLFNLRSADFDGDGRPDLVAGDSLGSADVFLNTGNGSFALNRRWLQPEQQYLEVGRFTSDQALGIVGTVASGAGITLIERVSK